MAQIKESKLYLETLDCRFIYKFELSFQLQIFSLLIINSKKVDFFEYLAAIVLNPASVFRPRTINKAMMQVLSKPCN